MFPRISFLTIIFSFLFYCGTKAQSLLIRGIVQDGLTHGILEDATVSLLSKNHGSGVLLLVKQSRSGKKGEFLFSHLVVGSYRVVTSYSGYSSDTTDLDLNSPDSSGKRLVIFLHSDSKLMAEVVVRAVIPPVALKGDTMSFNTGEYHVRPNANIEDLLRHLPGVEVDDQGHLLIQGQKVDRIYIDGKEFFLGDLRLATQNLPSEIVDQIEVFSTQSDQAKLSGIHQSSMTRSINLRLKRDRRKGYFGNLYVGGGKSSEQKDHPQSYTGGGTVTSLGKNWIFGLLSRNNINNQFTGLDNRTIPTTGLQTLDNSQFNFRRVLNQYLTLTLNAGSLGSSLISDQLTQQKTFLADSSLNQSSVSQQLSKNRTSNINAYLQSHLDSLTILNLRSLWSSTSSSSVSQDTTTISTQKLGGQQWINNRGRNSQTTQDHGYSISNTLSFARHWKKTPGRALVVTLTQSLNQQRQSPVLSNNIRYFDSAQNVVKNTWFNQKTDQVSKTESYGGMISYLEPLGSGHVISLDYNWNHSSNWSDRKSWDFDTVTQKYDFLDTISSNRFLNQNLTQQFGVAYHVTQGKMVSQLGLALQLSGQVSHNWTNSTTISQHLRNWYPRASLLYNFRKGMSLQASYMANTLMPTIQQLQPIPDLSNPFLVKIGNPKLIQQLTHLFDLDYNRINSQTFRNLQCSLEASVLQNAITQSTRVLSGGVQQQQFVNVNGIWHLYSHVTYGFPVSKIGNSSVSFRNSYGRDVVMINGSQNLNTSCGSGMLYKFNLHWNKKLLIDGNGSWDYLNSSYSISPLQNVKTLTQNYLLEASYQFSLLTIESSYNLQITGGSQGSSSSSLPKKQLSLWNASLYRDVCRHQALLRLSMFGILNTTKNFTQVVGPNYVETQQNNIPGRLLLLSFIYRFRHFPQP